MLTLIENNWSPGMIEKEIKLMEMGLVFLPNFRQFFFVVGNNKSSCVALIYF